MNINDVKARLDAIGNIKIVFEPSIYQESLISKKNLESVLESARVSLRGWSFPHVPIEDRDDGKRPYSIGNGIEFYTCWEKYIEIFRLHQSGQFLGRFAMYEDTIGEVGGNKIVPGAYLDFLSLIYRLTEVVLFIRNLVEAADMKGGSLTVELHKVRDRELESLFSFNIPSFHSNYVCRMDEIVVTQVFDRECILKDPNIISREIIKSIFEDFNWKNYSDEMIKTHQENLVNRRI